MNQPSMSVGNALKVIIKRTMNVKKIAQTPARLSQSRLTRTAPTPAMSQTPIAPPGQNVALHGLVIVVTTKKAIIASMMILQNVQPVSLHANKVLIISSLSTIAHGTTKKHALL